MAKCMQLSPYDTEDATDTDSPIQMNDNHFEPSKLEILISTYCFHIYLIIQSVLEFLSNFFKLN